jgi:hypothetical protein
MAAQAFADTPMRFTILEDGTLAHISDSLSNSDGPSPLLEQALKVIGESDTLKNALKDLPTKDIEFSQDNLLALAKAVLSGEDFNSDSLLAHLNGSLEGQATKGINWSEFDWSYDDFVKLYNQAKNYTLELIEKF